MLEIFEIRSCIGMVQVHLCETNVFNRRTQFNVTLTLVLQIVDVML